LASAWSSNTIDQIVTLGSEWSGSETQRWNTYPLPKQKQQSQNQTAREMMLSLSFQVSTEADSKSRTDSAPAESTLDTGRIVAELKRGRDRLSKAIAALDGLSPQPQSAAKDERCSQASHSQHKKG
jgi:hypothetical protein